jgi:2-iminobutanoate/2-iminopropanoate deaminase
LTTKEIVRVPGISDALAKLRVPISPAVKANGFVFVSGMPPLKPSGEMLRGDIELQMEAVLANVRAVLEAAGSSLDRVVKATIYIANAAYFDIVTEIYGRYFPEDPPARTFVTVGSWAQPFDVEMECIALAD